MSSNFLTTLSQDLSTLLNKGDFYDTIIEVGVSLRIHYIDNSDHDDPLDQIDHDDPLDQIDHELYINTLSLALRQNSYFTNIVVY
ncbi:hypothetical protein C2G38_2183812 [Gigaspora rosea]|uniref:Uncharacterized protein n=1 Tax=Gigaspora rosea TaxID=44941 RepID=A0A397VBN5_9GLOM|nr:hypothetical protein C2G38_2183812 [Gigaspora rosea]